MDGTDTWELAIATASEGKSPSAVRARTRNARRFAEWCAARGVDAVRAARADVDAYVGDLGGRDPQLASKVRCDLRAVLRVIDPGHAARAIGLGTQTRHLLTAAGTPLAVLAQAVVDQYPARSLVRAAALGRLFSWCEEVALQPTAITAADLGQFWSWLVEVGSDIKETKVVAKDFVVLRHSPPGRAILGEPEQVRRPLKLEDASPLRPRFKLEDLPRTDPLSDLPAPIRYRSVVTPDVAPAALPVQRLRARYAEVPHAGRRQPAGRGARAGRQSSPSLNLP
jgi:hypothetical protein